MKIKTSYLVWPMVLVVLYLCNRIFNPFTVASDIIAIVLTAIFFIKAIDIVCGLWFGERVNE